MRGTVVFSRVVDDPGTALGTALDRALDGAAVLAPAETVLFDAEDTGVIELQGGVPVAARHSGTGATGPDAVAALAGRGPYRVTLRDEGGAGGATDSGPVANAATGRGAADGAAIAPELPAELLADDPGLAERTRDAAPGDAARAPQPDAGESTDALAAFLANEEKIAAIQERAREEAERRAAEWGLGGLAADDGADPDRDPADDPADDPTVRWSE